MNNEVQFEGKKGSKGKLIPFVLSIVLATGVLATITPIASAASAVSLGSASNFAVLAGGGISNTGVSTLSGDLGLYPTVSYSDAGAVVVTGSYHFGDAAAVAAKSDVALAYSSAVAAGPSTLTSADIGGQTLVSGVYNNPAGIGVTGTLTLDAKGNPNSVFVFQTPSNLSTAASSQISLINGTQACNVFWQVGNSATLGANSDFKGNILSTSNFIGGANAKVLGRVLTLTGSVTLNSNQITKPTCATVSTLFVVPDSKSVSYGTSSPQFSVKYMKVNHDLSTVVEHPSQGNTGWVAPVCSATPVYASNSPVGTAVISCTGGNGGTLYTLDRSDTAVLTISKAATEIKVTTPKVDYLVPGSTLTFSGAVATKSGAGVCTGAITFALDKNPLTGVVAVYPITSPTATTNWMLGNYRLTATYPGDTNCLASVNNSKEIKIGTEFHVAITGAGSYISPYGMANFNLVIKTGALSVGSTPATGVNGQITWNASKSWRFKGNLTTYSSVNGLAVATGTGVLSYWLPSGHDGKWITATTGATAVTVKFMTSVDTNGQSKKPISSFAIGFTGTPVAGVPALPVLGPLVKVKNSRD